MRPILTPYSSRNAFLQPKADSYYHRPREIVADKAYDSAQLPRRLRQSAIKPMIPERRLAEGNHLTIIILRVRPCLFATSICERQSHCLQRHLFGCSPIRTRYTFPTGFPVHMAASVITIYSHSLSHTSMSRPQKKV